MAQAADCLELLASRPLVAGIDMHLRDNLRACRAMVLDYRREVREQQLEIAALREERRHLIDSDSLAKELSAHRIALAACQSVLKSAKAELREADIMLAKQTKKQCLDNCCNRCSNAANRIIGDCLKWDPLTNGERDATGHAGRGAADASRGDVEGGDRCNPAAPCEVRCAARPLEADGRNDQRRIWSSATSPPDGD